MSHTVFHIPNNLCEYFLSKVCTDYDITLDSISRTFYPVLFTIFKFSDTFYTFKLFCRKHPTPRCNRLLNHSKDFENLSWQLKMTFLFPIVVLGLMAVTQFIALIIMIRLRLFISQLTEHIRVCIFPFQINSCNNCPCNRVQLQTKHFFRQILHKLQMFSYKLYEITY